MAILARKTMFQFPQRNVRGGLTNELWQVYAAPDTGDDAEDPTGIVSPELIFTAGYAQGLPQVGDVHPTATLGLCTGGRVSQVVAKHSVMVIVSYQSYGLYNGAPRAASSGYSKNLEKTIRPIWVLDHITNTGGPGMDLWTPNETSIWMRDHMYRVESRTRAGNEVASLLNAKYDNLGKWYLIDGRYYVLSGDTTVNYTGGTTTRVDWVFESWAPHPAIAADNPLFQNNILIPAIGALEIWHSGINKATDVPFVVTVPRDQFCGQGGALPGFP